MRRTIFYFIFIVIYALRGLLGAPEGTYVEITPENLYDYFEPFVVEQLSGFGPDNRYPDGNTQTETASARFPVNPEKDGCILSYGEEYSVYDSGDTLNLYSSQVRLLSVSGYILLAED